MAMTDREIIRAAAAVVDEAFIGLLSTVDAEGQPHARYMGAAPIGDGLRRLYALSGRGARKIEELHDNPHVCWVFARPHYSEVATLPGTARIVESRVVAQQVWDRLAESARTYVMNVLSDEQNLVFDVIETDVHSVEYLAPSREMFVPQIVQIG